MDVILFWYICDICVRVFINYRRVPVMHGKVTLHALYEIDMGVILLCQMSRADELFVNIYIMCFCIIYELLVIGDNKTWLLLSLKVFFL